MKVIFLDFDGVINNYKKSSSNKNSFQSYGIPYLECNCYKRV